MITIRTGLSVTAATFTVAILLSATTRTDLSAASAPGPQPLPGKSDPKPDFPAPDKTKSDVPKPADKAAPDDRKPAGKKTPPPQIRIDREIRDIEGWKVHVDRRLLEGEGAVVGAKALKILANRLHDITLVVPAPALEKLRAVGIAFDLDHGKLTAMQYHPSPGWLRDNGYDPALARMVHVPAAGRMLGSFTVNQQPAVMLHELAHAYHDQVLDFEEPRIKAAWKTYRDSGKGNAVLHISGRTGKHYALTNQKEFFAEMTESFFATNDFHPFVRGALKTEFPELYKLLEDVWGTAAK